MEKVKLGEFVNIKTGKLDANASSEKGIYPFFTCSSEPLKIDDYSYDCECVLVAGNGDLNVKYYNGKFDAYQRTYIIESKNKKILDNKYLYYLINSRIEKLRKDSIGGVIKYIKLGNLTNIDFNQVYIKEQQNIVNKLDKIQGIIDIRKKQIEQFDELIKSQFVEMFELDKYELLPLSNCSKFIDYRGHTPEVSNIGDIRMINAKSVGKGVFKYIDEYVTEELYNKWMHRGFAFPGDVLFVTEGHTFGNTCRVPEELKKFALGQRVITIQGNEMLNNVYLSTYMQLDEFMNKINQYKTGGTAQGIRSKDLAKITIPIPPIKLQNKFAEFVKQIDKQKFEIQKSLEKMQLLQKSMMNKYFG